MVITASRLNLLGVAATASQGAVTEKELELRPVYRAGQLLETTPGLIVTVHSGEGKANQYLLRGFNLDHGTDIANFIDDMPINRPTNTHGQGYSDLNFELPEMANGLDFTKGPYYASVGDFGAVASTHLKLADEIPNQIALTGGTLGRYTVFGGGTLKLSEDDRVVGGVTYDHVDGPFDHPDNFRKWAGELRYSHGAATDGYNVTAMYYKGDGAFTTDQPVEALTSGLINRFGTLDPTDGNSSERFSLSGHFAKTGESWAFNSSAYYIHSRMTLWNDFTHYLEDNINGDQEQQTETRDTFGGQTSLILKHSFGPIDTSTVFGVQVRHDDDYVGRRHTRQRQVLDYCSVAVADPSEIPNGARANIDDSAYFIPANQGMCQNDLVHTLDLGGYVENTAHWTPWLRTVIGLRDEYYAADDTYLGVTGVGLTDGQKLQGDQTLLQPKGSLILGPFYKSELYLSAGRGFHSDDVRGVFGTVPIEGIPGVAGRTPFLAAADGYEVGVRTNIIPKVQVQVALFQEDFKSELTYDADQGQDAASAPSRRQGVEVSAQYKPLPWIEFNTDLAFSKARYQGSGAFLDTYGIDGGAYIANAPSFIGSFGVIADRGPWFGGLQWRNLGPYPLSDGPPNPQDNGYSEFNADLGYRANAHLTIEASGFNLLNTKANASGYDYAYRLTPNSAAEQGPTFHPLEPISGQLKATWTF
ncbi:MAG TPA: TonB-dependent receptor [Caulobacteraceae bacterium]|nr:TonB-dependent receptor [Caulobacteraceae bacterium]